MVHRGAKEERSTAPSRARRRIAGLWVSAWRVSRRYAPQSRTVALVIILVLMGTVTVLRWFVEGTGQAAALLYVVPISLSAVRFGRRGGLSAASVSIAAFVVLELVHAKGDLDVTGWVGPLVTMALMGGLVGHLSESVARNEALRRAQERRLDELRQAQLAAAEASDAIIQHVAAARWMLEVGRNQDALAALDATVVEGIGKTSGALSPLASRQAPDGDAGSTDAEGPS